MMFARLDFPRFLVCCSGDLSDNESEEKPSVAICGGSICLLTGLYGPSVYVMNVKPSSEKDRASLKKEHCVTPCKK